MNAIQKYDPNKIQTNAPASWGQVKYWAQTAAKGAMVMTAAAVMAGFTLIDLRKKMAAQGKRNDLDDTTSPHDVAKLSADKCGWQHNIKQYAGVSDETARRWMISAEGVRARWKKNPPQERLRELMRMPVSDWNEADTELVFKSLAKAIDGATMVEFMRELGLAKKPQGAGATGRLPECDNSKKKLSLSEEAALRKTQALEDWVVNWKQLTAYGEKFILLTDDQITAQCATLEQALKARKEWLKQPANKRNPKAIAEMVRFDPEDDKQFYAALEQLAPKEEK